MLKKIHLFILLELVFAFSFQSFAQTAWTHPKGNGYFKLSQSMVIADAFFNPDGEVIDITTTSIYQTGIYAEYGLKDNLTMVVNAPLFVRSTINNLESTANGAVIPGDEFNSIGDILIGFKYGLVIQGPAIWSASLDLKTPTGDPVGGDSELLQSGDGAFGMTFMTDISHSFYPKPVYISAGLGYNWRGTADLDYSIETETVNYADGFRWRAEIGYTPKNWLFALKFNHLIALNTNDSEGPNGSSSLFGNNITYLAITPEVAYNVTEEFGVSASAGVVAYAEGILAAPNFIFGIYYQL